jgi:hypothetical protein
VLLTGEALAGRRVISRNAIAPAIRGSNSKSMNPLWGYKFSNHVAALPADDFQLTASLAAASKVPYKCRKERRPIPGSQANLSG